MSTLDNVAFGLQRTKLSKKEKQDIARQQLKLVGLEDFEKARPSQLSGGMQQRVSIARALAGRPEILLLDEPFGALDAFTRINMQKELLNIWENERRTMIMVTHDIDEAIYLSNRVIILADGKVKKEFKVDLGHPRDRGDEDFLRVRGNIYHEFYESSKVMPEYNI
jgi:sulfonate transport system ATP-binding protein